jgi:hypothetical protein
MPARRTPSTDSRVGGIDRAVSQSQQFRDRDFTCPVVPMLDAPSSSIHAETWGVSMFAGQAEGCFELVLQGATMPWDPL